MSLFKTLTIMDANINGFTVLYIVYVLGAGTGVQAPNIIFCIYAHGRLGYTEVDVHVILVVVCTGHQGSSQSFIMNCMFRPL